MQDKPVEEMQSANKQNNGIIDFVRGTTFPLQPDSPIFGGSAQGILDSLIANICVVDRNGTILAVNRAWNRFADENDYAAENLDPHGLVYGIGRNYFDVCKDATGEDADVAVIVAQSLKEILNGERTRFSMEYPCHSRDTHRWFLLTISPIITDYGGAIISHFNVTEQTELRQANQTLDAFAQSLALAFRTPLGMMRSNLEGLIDAAEDLPPERQYNLRYLDENVNRLDSMVRDLLAYARVGRANAVLRPTDLQQAVNEALYSCSAEIKRKNARISVAETFPYIMADPVLLTEAIESLISNALKFVPSGKNPEITIYAENRPDDVCLWVDDRGIGINLKESPSIFTIFRRGAEAASYPGNGIGLAIVERSMRQMRGSVEVFPREGGGSRFKLVFPKRSGR